MKIMIICQRYDMLKQTKNKLQKSTLCIEIAPIYCKIIIKMIQIVGKCLNTVLWH